MISFLLNDEDDAMKRPRTLYGIVLVGEAFE
jgi:hypothetical protein